MAEILVKAIDHVHPDPVKDRRGAYKRGYPVVVMPDGHEWGLEERLPKFIVVKLPGVSVDTVRHHIDEWKLGLSFTVVSSVPSTDVHHIRIQATNFNPGTGEGKITRARIEKYLTDWGAANITTADNTVEFDANILTVIQRPRFWDRSDLVGFVITQASYNQTSGIHRIRINYSAAGLNAVQLTWLILIVETRGTIISHNTSTKIITVDIGRLAVRDRFLADIKGRAKDAIVRRRYRLSESIMATAVSNGGEITLDIMAYNGSIIDQMAQ